MINASSELREDTTRRIKRLSRAERNFPLIDAHKRVTENETVNEEETRFIGSCQQSLYYAIFSRKLTYQMLHPCRLSELRISVVVLALRQVNELLTELL